MKFFLPFLLLSLTAIADLNISSDLELKGSEKRHFDVVVRPVDIRDGKWSEATSNDITLKVNVFQTTPSRYAVETEILKKDEIIGRPTVITKLGRTAEATANDSEGKLLYRIKITTNESNEK